VPAHVLSGALAPLTATRLVATWRLDPAMVVTILLLAGTYLRGVARVRRGGGRWPTRRVALFVGAGCGGLAVVTMSGLAAYDRVLFWPAAVQYSLLGVLIPVAFAAGEPVVLARAALGEQGRRRLNGFLGHPLTTVLTFPLTGCLLSVGTQFALYFTGYFGAALRHPVVHEVLELQLLVTGCLFTVPLLGAEFLPRWCTYPVRLLIGFVDGLADAVPGVVVMTTSTLVAGHYYAALHRRWGPSLHWDQTIGGGMMMTLSELVAVPFFGALLAAWIRADAAEARVTDAYLDAVQAQTPGESGATATSGARSDDDPDRMTPWWEVDPGPLRDRAGRYGWPTDS